MTTRSVVVAIILSCLISVEGTPKPFAYKALTKIEKIDLNPFDDFNPFDDEGYDAKPFSEVFWPALRATLTTIYGTSLVLFAQHAPGQIHCLTMFRATGQDKLERAAAVWHRNLRDAMLAGVKRLPSFLMAFRSIKKMDDRVLYHRKLAAETKKAKSDGIITQREAKKLARLHKKEICNLKRDMNRLLNAGTGLGVVYRALDFDEVTDIAKGFLFQVLSVLATNHEKSGIGSLIATWCLFLNLRGLVLDTNSKLGFPITKLILNSRMEHTPKPDLIANTGNVIVFGSSAYLVLAKRGVARRLNTALLASAVVMRGLRTFVKTIISWDNDDDDGIWPGVGRFLDGATGGALMVALTAIGLYARHMAEKGNLTAPYWVLRPLNAVEKWIENLAVAADKIV